MRRKSYYDSKLYVLILVVACVVVALHNFNLLDRSYKVIKLSTMAKREGAVPMEQVVQYMSEHVNIHYAVLSDKWGKAASHELIISNCGTQTVHYGEWAIYFNHFSKLDSVLANPGVVDNNFDIVHVEGSLHKLVPLHIFEGNTRKTTHVKQQKLLGLWLSQHIKSQQMFCGMANTKNVTVDMEVEGLKPNDVVFVKFASGPMNSRSYFLPRWYVSAPGQPPRLVRLTTALMYPPGHQRTFSPQRRYNKYKIKDLGEAPLSVLPTPAHMEMDQEGAVVDLRSGDWVICSLFSPYKHPLTALSAALQLPVLPRGEICPPSHVITFKRGHVTGVRECDEAYHVKISAFKPSIEVTSPTEAGAYYAVQTLISLAERHRGQLSSTLPVGAIQDAPRFDYRGLHLDVARHFIGKDDVIKLIQLMGMYKINKLHLHLTDDEGWRLEIPGLPELTEVGSVRCHTMTEDTCLYPALGSGPTHDTSGTGHYTVAEYKEILRAGVENFVQVIPEIDTPGHCHAAIKSMNARYRKYMEAGEVEKAEEFLLHDILDSSDAISVQHFRNPSLNPCLPSSMRFLDHVIGEVVKMHRDVQPLTSIHLGGDEVPSNSWKNSPLCLRVLDAPGFPDSHEDLQDHFMIMISKLVKEKYGLKIGVWEEAVLSHSGNEPMERSRLDDCDVTAYAWNNIWEENAQRAHKLANAGYKVVLSLATHLYLDHPQEEDVEELGLAWASKYLDDQTVFNLTPDDIYRNYQYDGSLHPRTEQDVRELREKGEPLNERENVVGIQAQIWSELVRDVDELHHQLFPRLLPFAERAWHRAKWEEMEGEASNVLRQHDWADFAHTVGYKELPRLRNRGVKYRVPPPGVSTKGKEAKAATLYPGFEIRYRDAAAPSGGGDAWKEYDRERAPASDGKLEFVTLDGARRSRVVEVG